MSPWKFLKGRPISRATQVCNGILPCFANTSGEITLGMKKSYCDHRGEGGKNPATKQVEHFGAKNFRA